MANAADKKDSSAPLPEALMSYLKGDRRMLWMKQKNMQRMVIALTPILLSGIYFFGWRVLALLAVVQGTGLLTEWIMTGRRNKPISQANFVTCFLLALALPPTCPFWIAAVGALVAVLFGKEVFGGFGKNFVNPAILGRTFLYISFPEEMTNAFVPVFRGLPGGFGRWSWRQLDSLPDYLAASNQRVTDAVSQASPLWLSREVMRGNVSWDTFHEATGPLEMFLGNIGGLYNGGTQILSAGSIGEGCALLVVLAGVYLLVTKTANWRLMLSGLLGVLGANVLFRHVLGYDGVGGVSPVWVNLFGGTTLYALVFMVTDPVSAPKKKLAMIGYGLFIGFMTVFLRWRNVFVASASFGILLGNLVGPWLDIGAGWLEDRRKRGKTEEAKA